MDRTSRMLNKLSDYEKRSSPEEILKRADRASGLIFFDQEVCDFLGIRQNPDGTFITMNAEINRKLKIIW